MQDVSQNQGQDEVQLIVGGSAVAPAPVGELTDDDSVRSAFAWVQQVLPAWQGVSLAVLLVKWRLGEYFSRKRAGLKHQKPGWIEYRETSLRGVLPGVSGRTVERWIAFHERVSLKDLEAASPEAIRGGMQQFMLPDAPSQRGDAAVSVPPLRRAVSTFARWWKREVEDVGGVQGLDDARRGELVAETEDLWRWLGELRRETQESSRGPWQ